MAINRYDQPAQAEFINTYVPMPIDDLMKIDMMKAARIEEGEKQAQGLMAHLNDIMVHRADEPVYQEKIAEMQSRLDKVIQEQGNLGTMEARRAISSIITEQSRDPWWRAATQNYQVLSAAQKELEEAQKQKGSRQSDWYDLDKTIRGYRGVNEEIKSGNNTGFVSTPGTYAPTDVASFMGKQVDNLKASGWSKDAVTGDWIVTQGQEGVFAEQIANTFGLRYGKVGEEKDSSGKKVDVYGLDTENIKVPQWFINSSEGESTIRDARLIAERKGMSEEETDDLFKFMYAEHVNKLIHERTYQKSNMKISENAFALASHRQKLEDMEIPWTYPLLAGTAASKINSIDAVMATKAQFDTNIRDIEAERKAFVDSYAVDPQTGISKPMDEEYNYQLSKFDSELQQEEKKKKDLENLEKRTKLSVGLDPDYVPDQKVADRARNKAENKAKEIVLGNYPRVDDYASSEEAKEKIKNLTDKYYSSYLAEMDPKMARYNQALKENAEKSMVTIGATRFNSKDLNTIASGDFQRYYIEGGKSGRLKGGLGALTFVSTGKELVPGDYSNLSSEKPAEFLGWAYNSADGTVKFAYRPYDKEGNLMEAVWGDAPQGAEEYLIREGNVSEAEVLLHRQMAAAEAQLDYEDNIGLEIGETGAIIGNPDSQFSGKFRKLTKSESNARSGNPGYELVLKEKNKSGEIENVAYTFDTRSEVIKAYANYLTSVYSGKK